MSASPVSRRSFTATAAGFAFGAFALPQAGVLAQQATPVGLPQPIGFVSSRLRTLENPDDRAGVNERVLAEFAPGVAALEGYWGYLLGDVIDQPAASLSVVVLNTKAQTMGFDALARDFVSSLSEDDGVTVGTEQWAGDLLIVGSPVVARATPSATPVVAAPAPMTDGYVAMRVHTSLPGTDPRDFVPLATSRFLPIVSGLAGFRGYLWYPTEDGFVAISLFDSEDAALESNAAAQEWAVEFLTDYTDGNPTIINASIVYADLPILG